MWKLPQVIPLCFKIENKHSVSHTVLERKISQTKVIFKNLSCLNEKHTNKPLGLTNICKNYSGIHCDSKKVKASL